jgi:alanine racemase
MFENGNFFVTIRGHRCPLIGTMCMDHCLIDLTNVPDPQVGEEIVIYGDGSTTGPYDGGDGTGDGAMSVSEVAEKRGASNVDEVMCNINSKRVPRRMV